MKIAIQSGKTASEIGFEKACKAFAEAGFEAIDWNLDTSLPGKYINDGTYRGNCIFEKELDEILEYYKDELAAIKNNGLTISQAHAPFSPNIIRDEETFDYMIEIYKKMILFCDRVGCKNLIIHGTTLTKKDRINTPETIYAFNDKQYRSLIPTLLQTNVTVCLENLFAGAGGIVFGVCSHPQEAVCEIDRLNALAGKECFGLCLDTGHLNLLKLDCRCYIPILGNRIKALHIHDNDGMTDQHKAPYTGTINWRDFYTEMKKIGYGGDLSFETFKQTSIEVIDEELLIPWLKMIHEIGVHFRNKISQ